MVEHVAQEADVLRRASADDDRHESSEREHRLLDERHERAEELGPVGSVDARDGRT